MSAVEQTPELVAQMHEMRRWRNYHKHLKIEDYKSGHLITFTPNVIQQRISDLIDEKWRARQPVRLVILKSRRMGVSTLIQARFAHLAFASERWSGITGAHEARSSEFLHGMVETMYDALPDALKRQKAVGLRGNHLEFVEGSSLQTFTAGTGGGAGRGTGFRGIHASEVGFWENAADVLLSLRQVVPDAPGTIIVLESTANGLRNVFREEWERAKSGQSEYVPLFFAWNEFPDYQMPLDARVPGCEDGTLDPDWWRVEDYPDGAEDEEQVLRGLGCTEEQLAWRRWKIVNDCGKDLDKFHQEYPSTDDEAFLSSGSPFFAPAIQAKLARVVTKPRGQGDLTGDPLVGAKLGFVPSRRGPLEVYEPPGAGGPYLIGADSAGGISEDEREARQRAGERTDGDYNAAAVVDLSTGRTVADFQKRTDADLFARDLARLGWIYSSADKLPAEIAVESNGQGLLTLSKLRDVWSYPRIYHREQLSHEYRGRRGRTIGWHTNAGNRGMILGGLREIVRERPDMLPSRRLLDQIRTFIEVSETRYEHAPGAHDDLIFAYAIAYFLFHQRSHFPSAVAVPRTVERTPADLEAWAMSYRDTGGQAQSLRAIALARPPRR